MGTWTIIPLLGFLKVFGLILIFPHVESQIDATLVEVS